MNLRQTYSDLVEELKALEQCTGLYLYDECVDRENLPRGIVEDSDEYFVLMIDGAKQSAGLRCEEAGKDINKLLDRVIY